VTDDYSNVVTLPERANTDSACRPALDSARLIVRHLDELGFQLRQLLPHPARPASKWMIASTIFRLRLAGARGQVDELAGISPSGAQGVTRWALELNDSRRAVERGLHDVAACLCALHRADISPAERARENESYAAIRAGLLEALSDVRRLVGQRFPAALRER
jgi:hypothetical protein